MADHNALRAYLAQVGAADLVPEAQLSRLRLRKLKSGQHLLEQGAPITHLYLLCEGRLKVCSVSEDGKYGTVALSTPPQFLGDIEFFHDFPSLHSVVAETDAVLIAFPLQFVRTQLANSIEFYRLMCKVLMDKLYNTSRAYSTSLLYPAKNRLTQHLLQNAAPDGTIRFVGVQVAAVLGITPRHLSRLMAEMTQDGLLSPLRPKTYRLSNRPALEQLAALYR